MDDVTYVVQGDRAVEEKASNYKTYVKVFLYFALGLIITGVVAICFSLLLQNLYTNGYAFEATYITVTIVSVIAMIISALFIGIKAFSKGSKLIIPYIIYSNLDIPSRYLRTRILSIIPYSFASSAVIQ